MDIERAGMGAPPPSLEKIAAKTDPNANKFVNDLNRLSGAESRDSEAEKTKHSGTKMGKDEFLKLFMHQLKNQDPMSPMKGEEFSNHMAMFSQLEQQINMNKNLEKMLEQKSDNKMDAVNFIGKEIEGSHASFSHDKNGVSAVNFEIPQDANELHLDIVNDRGEIVRAVDLGQKTKGPIDFKWDGKNDKNEMAETGRYFYKVAAKDMNGQPISVGETVKGRVTGVTTQNGNVFLLVGEQKVELKDIQVIRESADKASSTGASAKKNTGTESVSKTEETTKTDQESGKTEAARKGPEISIADEIKEDVERSARNDAGSEENFDDLNSPIPFWYR